MVYLQSFLKAYTYLGSERVHCKTDRVFNKGMGYYAFEFIVFMCGWDELIESDCFILVKGKYLWLSHTNSKLDNLAFRTRLIVQRIEFFLNICWLE